MTAFGLTREEIRRQIQLPWSEAFRISWRYVTIRLGRSLVTASTIFLSVSFLMAVCTMILAAKATGHAEEDPQAFASTLARYKWSVLLGFMICATGIISALLMSVTERFREIGTMKCLGALDNFIVRMFLIEASLMGLFGSLAGAIVGASLMLIWAGIKEGFSLWAKIHWGVKSVTGDWGFFGYFLASITAGIILSVLSAIVPAYRAAKLQAADALRTEI
jgi:predicted lysophospholipase L1 biosynthesis ABC-type transport system permease subunit